jgi:hypothetical protein
MERNDLHHKEYLEATQRGKEMRATNPMAVAAYYNRKAKRVVVSLSTKVEVMFNPSDVQSLENAKPSQLEEIEITPSGFGLYFPELDEGINVLNLLEGTMGSRKWMAARLGAQGGKARTQAKADASRANGALGGPPRKTAHKSRKHMLGSGMGKIWVDDDAFSPETDLEIQKLFEAHDPKFDNLGPKPAKKKRA